LHIQAASPKTYGKSDLRRLLGVLERRAKHCLPSSRIAVGRSSHRQLIPFLRNRFCQLPGVFRGDRVAGSAVLFYQTAEDQKGETKIDLIRGQIRKRLLHGWQHSLGIELLPVRADRQQ